MPLAVRRRVEVVHVRPLRVERMQPSGSKLRCQLRVGRRQREGGQLQAVRRLDDGLRCRDIQQQLQVVAVSQPQLLRCHDNDAAAAVSQEDGRLTRADEEAAAFTQVDGDCSRVVEQVDVAVLAFLHHERLAAQLPQADARPSRRSASTR